MPGPYGLAPSSLLGRAMARRPAPDGPLLHHLPPAHLLLRALWRPLRTAAPLVHSSALRQRNQHTPLECPLAWHRSLAVVTEAQCRRTERHPQNLIWEPPHPLLREGEPRAGCMAGPGSCFLCLLLFSPPLLFLRALARLCRMAGRPSHYHPEGFMLMPGHQYWGAY